MLPIALKPKTTDLTGYTCSNCYGFVLETFICLVLIFVQESFTAMTVKFIFYADKQFFMREVKIKKSLFLEPDSITHSL